ncbi:hypothetical protein IKF57_02640 [Candidatus Saccharibacteria bacterium]|nr:hypothetical protein [Candidatus Saccharibacteria bacterium]
MKGKKKNIVRPRDAFDDLLDIEFCPGMMWLFEILNSQRHQLGRICSRFAAIRHRISDWRAEVVISGIETTDKTLDHNIGQCLALLVTAGYNPKLGFYQPDFDKKAINRPALRSYLGENAEILDKLDELITVAIESSWIRTEFTAMELDAWSSGFKHVREFNEQFKKEVA